MSDVTLQRVLIQRDRDGTGMDGDDDESSSSSGGSSDGGGSDEEMEDAEGAAPRGVPLQQAKPEPVVDADGFELVQKGRRRR